MLLFWLTAVSIIFSNTAAFAANASSGADQPDNRLRVLLLTYNMPTEHDVLQSLLCIEPCTEKNGCPKQYLKFQLDKLNPEVFWNNDFVVIRPSHIGSPSEMVERFADFSADFISMSGHHSSGFFGKGGSFNLEALNVYNDGQNLKSVFGGAALVMLNGCNTEVKSDFIGDPHAYIRHIVEDTDARGEDLPRLMAAIAQISGIQKSYRQIYPNACIMGYQGTSIPGGVPQIYSQYTNALRGLYNINTGSEIKPRISMLTGDYAANEKKVFRECNGNQWPCNLCEKDSEYYRMLKNSLATYLREERTRHEENRALTPQQAGQLENAFSEMGFYKNSKWACSTFSPDTNPVLPDKSSLPKNGKLLLQVLFIPPSERFQGNQYNQLRNELLHQLAMMRMSPEELKELRALVRQPENMQKFMALQATDLDHPGLRDFYAVAIKFQCRECLPGFSKDGNWFIEQPLARKRAFVDALQPEFGDAYYQIAMRDRNVEIRERAAGKFGNGTGDELYLAALADVPSVAEAAASTFNWDVKISDKVRMAAMNSPSYQVRSKLTWVADPGELSNKVMLLALTGPYKEEFLGYVQYLNEKSNSEVLLAAMNLQATEPGRTFEMRQRAVEQIRGYHNDQVFEKALSFNGEFLELAQIAAERISARQSVAVMNLALSHTDVYVRNAAARRLSEFKETALFAKALSDPESRVRWAAAQQLRPEVGSEPYRLALQPSQSIHVRSIAARKLDPSLDATLKNMALADQDPDVRDAARRALGMEN